MLGCGCLTAILMILSPRFLLILVWLFTDKVSQAFGSFVIPFLGFLLLPFTTVVYVFVYNPTGGLSFFDILLLIFAFLVDIGSYASSAYEGRNRIACSE